MEWQPIETAPTKGLILAWDGEEVHIAEWHPALIFGGDWYIAEDEVIDPTHWMPLPAPPHETEDA